MRRTRRRFADKERRENRLGGLLIGGSVLAVVAVVVVLVVGKSPQLDARTGCPLTHRSPPAHTVILIDQTDVLPASEVSYARELIYNEYYWLPLYGQLTILNIMPSGVEQESPIILCRMPDSDEVSAITNTPAAIRRRFEQRAGARLTESLTRITRMTAQNQSPIMESISQVIQRTDFADDVPSRRLVILSDMAQNSGSYSDYGRIGWSAQRVDSRFRPDMSGVAVRVHYIRRAGLPFQGGVHERNWINYFNLAGATDVAIGHRLQLGEAPNRRVWHSGESSQSK